MAPPNRADVIAWGALGVSAAVVAVLLGTGYFFVVPVILALIVAVLLGANRGLPYLLLFAALASLTGIKAGQFTAGDAAAVGTVVFAIIGRLVHRDPKPITWPYLAPAAIFLWGSIVAAANGIPVVPVAIFAGSIAVVIAAFTLPVRTERHLSLVAMAFVIGASVNSFAAVLDYLNVFDVTAYTAVERLNQTRPPGLATHSNQLALVTYLALPFAYYLAERRKAWLIAVATLGAGALATGSRGALIGVALVTALHILFSDRGRVAKTCAALVGGLGAYLAATEIGFTTGLNRLLGGDASATQSDVERARRAEHALTEFLANPISGVGFTSGEAHNFYLEIARSGGLVTLLIVVVFAATILIAGWRARKVIPLATPALISATAWFVMAFQQNSLNVRFIWVPIGFVLAAVALSTARTHNHSSNGAPPATRRVAGSPTPISRRARE